MTSDNITSFEKSCRTCLKEDSLMFDLYMERLDSTSLADLLLSCTRLKIQNNDYLPKHICRYCYNCLVSFHHFCNMAHKAEKKLIEALINSDGYHNINFEVKIENIYDNINEPYHDGNIYENVDDSNHLGEHNSNAPHSCCKINRPDVENKMNCLYCNKYYSNLSKHYEEKHKSEINNCIGNSSNIHDMLNGGNPKTNVKIESNDTDLTCIICTSTFDSMNSLSAHLKSHEDNWVLRCDQCNKVFKKVGHYKRHKITHSHIYANNNLNTSTHKENFNSNICETKSKWFQCDKCLQTFKNINSLSAHMRKHIEKDRVLSCKECKKVFKKISHLKRHELQHEINHPYKCTACSKSFLSEDTLNDHTHTHETVKSPSKENLNINICETNSDQFKCNKCLQTFRSINSLSAHMRKHTEKGRVLSCKQCKKVFKKISHLKRHELQHENNRPYKCTVCTKSFASEDTLKSHTVYHRAVKPHSCPVCDKKFPHLTSLSTHIKIHTREKTFLCPTCGKKFDSSTNLNQHMSRHIGLKKFACTLCPKKFISKGELKSHESTHTGERSFTCDQCGATFTKRSSLTKHKMRHLGLKPHQCDTCLMRFTCKDHLKRHYRIHTGEKPYKCEICGRAFTQSNDLVKHSRAHLGDKIYKCSECSECFRLKTELRNHISEHFISSQKSKDTPTDGVDIQTVVSICDQPIDGVNVQPSDGVNIETTDGVDVQTRDGVSNKSLILSVLKASQIESD